MVLVRKGGWKRPRRFVVALVLGIVCLVLLNLRASMPTKTASGAAQPREIKFVGPDGNVVDVTGQADVTEGGKTETDARKSLRTGGIEAEAAAVKMQVWEELEELEDAFLKLQWQVDSIGLNARKRSRERSAKAR